MPRTRPGSGLAARALAAVSLLASAGIAALVVACSAAEPPPSPSVRPVRTVRIPAPAELENRTFPGRARPSRRSDLSFDQAGRILELPVEVGQPVEAGELLAALDSQDLTHALHAARAAETRARAERDRMAAAHRVHAVSDQQLSTAEARFEAAAAKARLDAKALEDSRIFAPHAGVVSAVFAERFEVVGANQPIVRVIDASRMEMVVDVPAGLIHWVSHAAAVRVRFDALADRVVEARVAEIGGEASSLTLTYPVTLVMDQPAGASLEAGMTGRAAGVVALPEGAPAPPPRIPESALLAGGSAGVGHVWVVDPGRGKVSLREVQLGGRTAQGIAVRGGLEPAEWIAVAGANSLHEGQAVKLLDANSGAWRLPFPRGRNVRARDATQAVE